MAIALDAATSFNAGSAPVNTATFAHTVGAGSNRMLLVGVSIRNDTSQSLAAATGVTYGGTALTFVAGISQSTNVRVELWSMVAPPSGTANVVVTLTGATTARIAGGARSFTGVHQSLPARTAVTAQASTTTPTATTPSATGELVVDFMGMRHTQDSAAPTAPQVQDYANATTDVTSANNVRAYASHQAGAASVTSSWTITTVARPWAMVTASLRPQTTVPADPAGSWQPVGQIISQAKLTAAGVSTRQVVNVAGTNYVNTNMPSVVRRPSWWAGNPAWGKYWLFFSGHTGDTVLLFHTDTLDDPNSWISAGPVLTYETVVDLAADLTPDGTISPVAGGDSEELTGMSVLVDNVAQNFKCLAFTINVSRANLSPNCEVGLTTTDFSSYAIHGAAAASKALGYNEYSRWANPAGFVPGTDVPVLVSALGAMAKGTAADPFAISGASSGWETQSDPTNELGFNGVASEMRHPCADWLDGEYMRLYYSGKITDPEQIESVVVTTVPGQDVSTWRAVVGSHRVERSPLLDWEGVGLGGRPSSGSYATQPFEQLRDPHVFYDDAGTRWLVCAVQGEYGIGLYKWAAPAGGGTTAMSRAFVRAVSSGALRVTTSAAGAAFAGGFLRAPTGEIVVTTDATAATMRNGFLRAPNGALVLALDAAGTMAAGFVRTAAGALAVTQTGPGNDAGGFRRSTAGLLLVEGLS